MKNQTAIFVAVCLICLLFYRCSTNTQGYTPVTDSASLNTMHGGYTSQVQWGAHLVSIAGCNDCHTPKKMTDRGPVDDTSLMLSGHPVQGPVPELEPGQSAKGLAATYDNTAWQGPWGRSYAANLTPDSTGIGGWSEEQFLTCIRKGIAKGVEGSRPLMPPMPVAGINNMTDDELKAIFAYLKTIKPISNVVAEYQPPTALKN